MINTILVGVNDTAPSLAATRWALHRAVITRESIVLVHVLSDTDAQSVHIRDLARSFLTNQVISLRVEAPEVDIRTELLVGNALEQLSSAAVSASLLVIGTHKTGFVQGRVFGSKFIQLAATVSCSLAILPITANRANRAGIVIGVEDTDITTSTLEFAVTEALRSNSTITLVHCWTLPALPGETFNDHSRRELLESLLADNLLASTKTRVQSIDPHVTVRTRSLRRPPAEGLVESASTAQLLILSRISPGTSGSNVLGSTVHDVLLNLATATIIVPPETPVTDLPELQPVTAHRTNSE